MRFLVVDDSLTARAKISHILHQNIEADIIEAENGVDAYKLIEENDLPFNLIICDWNMPQMNGFDLLKKIRLEGNEVPFMMVTSYAGNSDVMDALNTGANNYLPKPFTSEQLLKKVNRLIA